MIGELRTHSDRFAELWDSGAVGRHEAARKTIDHPQVGPMRLDCDVLTVAGSDLRIMIYTPDPGTEDSERLTPLTPLDTRAMSSTPPCHRLWRVRPGGVKGSEPVGGARPALPVQVGGRAGGPGCNCVSAHS
ncbi:hypothetical protein [Streptomyces sp. MI02-7b]|uniref:MmyB family transcriptional regulator n=1 Tax=Streptomyces sp. MI02-7b TaxID=462941 RepID=UPI0039F56E3D